MDLYSRHSDMDMEFDLVGCPVAFANAFRRLMLSEVPSMAIEKVYIFNNTSIIPDEVLAHRLGLIPLRANPLLFQLKSADDQNNDEGTEVDTLDFELKFKGAKRSGEEINRNQNVYSSHIKWLPKGKQGSLFKESAVGPIHDDILISKMRSGHELDLKLIAVKGLGKDHAKFSPVATAHYRLLPEIKLNRAVSGKDAKLLQKCFSPGVIQTDDNGCAYVADARYDSCSRNVFRYPQLADAVTASRVQDHFLFTVESVGAMPPDTIFVEAVKVLKKKCRTFLDELQGH